MSVHKMSLVSTAFKKMSEGKKSIELRLLDEKRRAIIRGDHILFTCLESGEQMTVEVLKLHVFSSFEELYKNLPLDKCGYEKTDNAHPTDMDIYYTKEEQKKYDALGIEIKLVKKGCTLFDVGE